MSDTLTVTILGCGSSGGVPRIGNDWGACDPENPKNTRKRCSILVERNSNVGITTVLIDTGPDLRQQLLDVGILDVDAVLYTHSHADHLHGIDDLRMLSIRNRKRVIAYMDDPTYQRADLAFGYCFRQPEGSSYPPILTRRSLKNDVEITIDGAGGALTFLPIEIQHGEIKALGFRFQDIAYLPDVSEISPETASQFADLDVWILDSLRRPPHPSHFNLDDALAWVRKLEPKHTILTNMHNDLDYDTLKNELPADVSPAFDGLKFSRNL